MRRQLTPQPVRAEDISRALARKHSSDFFMTEVKNGPSGWSGSNVRMDAVAIAKSWTHPCIYGYEIKVSRQDFLNDKKWPIYKEQTHSFSFVCPKGLIDPKEVGEDVGLIYYNQETGALYTRKKAKYRECEMNAGMLLYIIMNRLESDRYPFFSSKREYLEAYIRDETDKKRLGWEVSSKMAHDIQTLANEKKELEREIKRLNEMRIAFKEIHQILEDAGIVCSLYTIPREVEKLVKGGLPNSVEIALKRVVDSSRTLDKYLNTKSEELLEVPR